MRSMVEGASIVRPLRLASLATSPAPRGRNRSIGHGGLRCAYPPYRSNLLEIGSRKLAKSRA